MNAATRREAIAKGFSTYFTGKPCLRGHIAMRFINNGCCECHKTAKNKESRRIYHQRDREKNKERIREQQRDRRSKIKESGKMNQAIKSWEARRDERKAFADKKRDAEQVSIFKCMDLRYKVWPNGFVFRECDGEWVRSQITVKELNYMVWTADEL